MTDHSCIIRALEEQGDEIFWFGAASVVEIDRLEELLQIKLPKSYRSFLSKYGGGGIIESEISGIEDNSAELDFGGTVLGDTIVCRKEYGLPQCLAVVFFKDDEICWCLDSSKFDNSNECPVVSYNLFTKRVDRTLADSFDRFFEEFLAIRVSRADRSDNKG